MKERKQYTKEFKEGAARLVTEQGRTGGVRSALSSAVETGGVRLDERLIRLSTKRGKIQGEPL